MKKQIEKLFSMYKSPKLYIIKERELNLKLEKNSYYKCSTLKSLSINIDNINDDNFVSYIEFKTGFNCYPMKLNQPNEIYMIGEDTKNGVLINKSDTTYKIKFVYDNNKTVPRKFKGIVAVVNRGFGKYNIHTGFSKRDELIDLAMEYYNNRKVFKYSQITPLTYYNKNLNPLNYLDKWKTSDLYHIDCSTFTNLLFKARGYNNSIYKNISYGMGPSKKYNWGFDIGRTAAEQAAWCIKNGYQLDISTTNYSEWFKLMPGDLVFWESRSKEAKLFSFMGASHVAIVKTPKSSKNTTTTLEVSTNPNVILNRSLQNNYPDKILFFARIRL